MTSLIRALFYRMPKVGNIYAWETEDPFSKPDLHTVLDTNRGWVKFKSHTTGTVFTCPLWVFHLDYVKVES